MDVRLSPQAIFSSFFRLSSFHFVIFYLIQTCSSYNFENRLPLFKYGPQSSTFGFSVAQHRISKNDYSGLGDTLLVVGAPTADELSTQKGVEKPGGVFYCPVTTDPHDCIRVDMDSGGDSRNRGIKSGQWLGVSLKSQGPGGMLISCAHRWKQHFNSDINEIERICGKCFLLNATNGNIEEIQPDDPSISPEFASKPSDLLDSSYLNSKRTYAYMQAGTSLTLHTNNFLLGAPGAWSWTGAMFEIGMPKKVTSEIGLLLDDTKTEMYQTPTCFSDELSRDKYRSKCRKIPVRRDSYMGFSVAASSKVGTDSDEVYYAAGSPRGNHTGAVLIFKKEIDSNGNTLLGHVPVESVVGESVASSFGYSIAFTDVNADGLDDLIVGAPQFYQYTNKGKLGGAVYVYLNEPTRGFKEVEAQKFFGPLDSFFGHSVEPLGDIDQDGYGDFAVGSPYEEENGVVHIYRGSANGKVKRSQTLKGSDYPHVFDAGLGEIKGFGASLSGMTDADSNRYPDLLVGTLSNHVSLFRTRPIISVNMTLKVTPKQIDLNKKNCDSEGKMYSCFKVKYCFSYKARHAEYTEDLKLKYTLKLDTIRTKDKKSSRVHFESPDGSSSGIQSTVTLPQSDQEVCPGNKHTIYFSENVEDRLSDIGVKFEFYLDQEEVQRESVGSPVFVMINDPILDADLDTMKEDIVTIKTNCGSDGCDSNLTISANMPHEVIVGDANTLTLTVKVGNNGEEAHQAFAAIILPPKVTFKSFLVTESSGADVQCYAASSGETSFIRCDLGNPYKTGSKDVIDIKLDISQLTSDDKQIKVQVNADTSSRNPEIARVALQSQVIIHMDISLTAQAQPQQVRYDQSKILGESAMNYTDQIGPLVVYTFNVKNEASQPASGIGLSIKLPYEIRNGKWLLYPVSSDVNSGGPRATGVCEKDNNNVLQLPLKASRTTTSRTKRSALKDPTYEPIARASSSGGSFHQIFNLACSKNTASCITINCQLDDLMPGTTTSIILQAHVWKATFLEEFKSVDLVFIDTTANLTTLGDNIRFVGDKTSETVRTTVDHDFFEDDVSSTFPWWYILIGVIVVLIIYLLIFFILIKVGFFKRKKFHKEEPEEKLIEEERKEREKDMGESNL